MEVPNHLHVYAWSVINRSEASRERDRLCRLIMTLKDHILLLQNAHVIVPVFFFFCALRLCIVFLYFDPYPWSVRLRLGLCVGAACSTGRIHAMQVFMRACMFSRA